MPETGIVVTAAIVAAAAAYALAYVLLLRGRARPGFVLFALGWLLNAGLVGLNWIVAREPPLGNMYHVLVFLALCSLPAYFLLRRKEGLDWVHAYFAFTAVVPLLLALVMDRDVHWRRVPALKSPWFVPHVVSYMISYALAGVACTLTVVGIAKRRRAAADPRAARYGAAAYQILRLGFPFMTFGMLSGALWAEEAWGVYWSWDPKETWSLITWTLYVAYFHCRLHPKLRRYAEPAQLLAFAALLTTFFAVNLLPRLASLLHSYA